MAWIVFFVLLGTSAYYFLGAFAALGSVLFYVVAMVIALILGPKKPFKRLPVRGWDPAKTRYDERGIPILE